MNNKTLKGMKCILYLFCSLMMALPVQAASFDCTKAQSKVEHQICDNPEISKLDEKLSAAYKITLQDEKQTDTIKKAQKQWMKERNACSSTDCLARTYQSRISELAVTPTQTKTTPSGITHEEYALTMSKNDEMCNHMLQLMNNDLEQFDRTYDSNDRFVSSIEEFKAIPWKPARASFENNGKIHYWNVESALFDLNNDGVLDFVVRDKSMLSGMRVDGLYIFDRSVATRVNTLTTKELFESNNQISMDQVTYMLSTPLKGRSVNLWLLSPFIYHGISYIYMQSLYKKDEAVGMDFVVIAKYIGGKFKREMMGKMEDVCYIERIDVK